MTCHQIRLPDGGVAIACTGRGGRVKQERCKFCDALGAKLLCDGKGCDKPLCGSCAVSPREGVDYCPQCFAPAWAHWKVAEHGAEVFRTAGRSAARGRFRAWCRANAATFTQLLGERAR